MTTTKLRRVEPGHYVTEDGIDIIERSGKSPLLWTATDKSGKTLVRGRTRAACVAGLERLASRRSRARTFDVCERCGGAPHEPQDWCEDPIHASALGTDAVRHNLPAGRKKP